MKGERHRDARLTTDQVLTIKARLAAGEAIYKVAADYPEVGYMSIWGISSGKNWGWLK